MGLLIGSSSAASLPAPSAIDGYTTVATALNATGTGTRYDIGGGNNDYTELSGLDWQSLSPGDVVNIYYRSGVTYNNLILVSEQGTAANPIIINGVTDASGNRPIIDADAAVVVDPGNWDADFLGTMLMLHRNKGVGDPGYGNVAQHVTIQNLEFRNATNAYQYDPGTGLVNYSAAARSIWSHGAQYINIYGCVFRNCGSAIFAQAPAERVSKTFHISGCLFDGNGDGNRDHQVYFQAVNDPGEKNIIEGNVFDDPRTGVTSVAQLKIRGSGNVVRYNWFTSSQRTIDLVEGQDEIPNWLWDNLTTQQIQDEYYTTYIYGNTFVIDWDVSGQPGQLLHAGMDTLEPGNNGEFQQVGSANGQPANRGLSGGATYFYNNTLYHNGDSAQVYRTQLFDLDSNNEDEATYLPGKLVAINNVLQFGGSTRMAHGDRSGDINYDGCNLTYVTPLNNSILYESDAYANAENTGDDPGIDITVNGNILTDTASLVDPTNATLLSKDLELSSGSAAIGQATALPAALSSYPVQNQPADPATGGADLRSGVEDLGAYENGSSTVYDNFNGAAGALDSSKWTTYEDGATSSELTITQTDGKYNAAHALSTNAVTTWFDAERGRLDYFAISGDFDVILRNAGIGTTGTANDYQFCGLLCGLAQPDDYEFMVNGIRGGASVIQERKTTQSNNSDQSEHTGAFISGGFSDMRVKRVGSTVSWYTQAPGTSPDSWTDVTSSYTPLGRVSFGTGTVWVGIVTYGYLAIASFTGTADQIEIATGTPI